MLLSVTFEYVAGFVSSAGKEISEEEGAFSLMSSSFIVGLLEFVCVLVLTPP